MNVIIPGQTASQKNNKQIVGIFPIKGSPRTWRGIPTLSDSKIAKKWRENASTWLTEHYSDIDLRGKQVYIKYTFYLKDRVRRDVDNMQVSCNDALVAAGIIDRDDWQVLRCAGAEAYLDKDNPRAEMEITVSNWSIDYEESN